MIISEWKLWNLTSELNASSTMSWVMHFAIAELLLKLYFRSVNSTGVPALRRSPLSNWINLVLLWLINTSGGGGGAKLCNWSDANFSIALNSAERHSQVSERYISAAFDAVAKGLTKRNAHKWGKSSSQLTHNCFP